MSKHLVIVESPAKAKTIKKYLGQDFEVIASYGHVRDLLPKKGSVDPENGFAMKYEIIERNSRHIDNIAKLLKQSDSLYLATDPDREGEAISWHVYEIMQQKKLLKDKPVHRIFFNEITKRAIQEAVQHPRQISMDLVNAQQARRALDYLVGFNLSPLLWKKIRRGLSAGRVQSPALRLIVEREIEIENFTTQEYWTVKANLTAQQQNFTAKLISYQDEKLQQFSITTAEQAHNIEKELTNLAQGFLTVSKITKKQRKRNPAAPFITSTLQQEAARKLGFGARRTMIIAQQLYEGINIGSATVGLISYMRTDSVNLAQEAIEELRKYITKTYGKENLPDTPKLYKTKSKNAQEAHEAIRPTSVLRTPLSLEQHLTTEQYKLYDLIWKRTVACQMTEALVDTVTVDLACGEKNNFRANGSTIAHPGFMTIYQEGKDDDGDEQEGNLLPEMKVGDKINLQNIIPEQHFTEPPPRYSEATLIKSLEEHGIGRPSTYATIIHTIQQREYVILDQKRFKPTDIGRIVNKFLTNYFTQYVDYGFTADLEDQLDAISRGEKEWIPILSNFWQPFTTQVDKIEQSVKRQDVTTEILEDKCPKCEQPLAIRLGKRGRFIGCTAYPDCDYTSDLASNSTEASAPEIISDRKCPDCEHDLLIKSGKYGKFIGCSNYPNCKYMEPLEKPADTNVLCPQCSQANILQRKSRRGKIFYSCARYPDCDYAIWNEPLNEPCPKCNWPILSIKTTQKRGSIKLCTKKECGYTEKIIGDDSSSLKKAD